MGSVEIWIASVLERYLASYGQGPAGSTEYEDDGSNLRFSTHVQHSALIQSWREQEDVPKLILTDSKSQIEAILTHEALRAYEETAPGHPLSADLARGYYIQLLDFQVVLEYSLVEPKVHLYVQRFDIDWRRGKTKSAPQGKFVNKNPSVKKLMQHVIRDIRGPETQDAVQVFDDSFGTQAYQDTRTSASQDILMSQIPSMSAFKRPAARTSSVSSSQMTNNLLGNTEMRVGAPDVPESSSDNVHRRKTKAAEQLRSRQNSVETTKPSSNSITARRSSSATSPTRLENATGTGEPDILIRPPSEPVTQKIVNQPRSNPPGEGFVKETTCAVTANGSTSIANQKSPNKPSSQSIKSEGRCPSDTDPWHGMTKIRRRDIEIPKEQAELLEQHRRRWIPPSPGESTPQGHVPPKLLDQWNKTALRRSRMARETFVDVESESQQLLPSQSSPTPQTDAESEGEPLTSDWSSSPEQASRSRQVLPEDSSPVRVRTFRKGGPLNETSEQPPRGSLESARDDPIIPRSMSRNKDNIIDLPPKGDGQLVGSEESQMKDTNQFQGLQGESDAESEDSVMDTSVPCPLGGDLQQMQLNSQSEQEVTSSGSSLPGPRFRDHVQVVDTPDNNVRHQRSSDFAKNDAGLQARHREQLSSEAAKSSSQSRILNTYASSGSKGTSSQDRQDGGAAHKNLDILGTQVSNGSLPTHDTTSGTTSDMGFNSSASVVQPPSVSINVPIHYSQSDPFSSYREMPSSIPSEMGDEDVASIEMRDTPAEHPIMPRPKRRISEVEQEQGSPSKRPKTEPHQQPTKGPALNIVVRRQSYINHSTRELEEAQRVYEKFRRDYPNYQGDFAHFTELCSKLHAVRSKGHLQRSFLWDDFIIKHLEDYSRYLEDCLSAGTKSLSYEEFFSSSYSRPSYKKRSITTHGIEVNAAQYVSADQTKASDTDIPSRKPNASFTGSLVERFTDLHAHSFGPDTQGTQSDTDMDYMSCFMSSPTPQTKVKSDTNAPRDLPVLDEEAMETASEQGPDSSIPVNGTEQERDGLPMDEQPLESSVREGETYYEVQDPFSNEDTPSAQLEQHLKSTLGEKEEQSEVNTREGSAIVVELVEMEKPKSSAVGNAVNRTEIPSAAHEASQEDNLDSSVPESEEYIIHDQPRLDLDSSIPESEAAMANPASTEQADVLDLEHHSAANSPQSSSESDIVSESSHDQDDDMDSEAKPTAAPLPPDSEAKSSSDHSDEDEDEDEDEDMIDETHETASIELGAETQVEAAQPQQQHPDTEPEAESDTESVNENWFVSLRHIRPKGPVWSDDPNTPFKQWARADQNVLSERDRRGGAYLPVDEKGVIQRPGYRR
ncbi:hypothetical protein ASPBRDRAFT_176564 [Aspergillus brasiliensis CBS 101740]|uniref:Telomere replication protein EST3 n=1 Tax=Aspergillus brasiliensis (strain CBS 101740 / IMI 381727 / IBT 21946) TaxID=767769 RepID=A0A1L9UMM6_ASPBC|nr:hypothetical protein ASPBRDRAFT_176564 [Aspergillus brasiliensis CBS 101740]